MYVFIYTYFIHTVLPPEITNPPVSQAVSLLQDAVFICSATGYDISYQWDFKPTSKPGKIIGIGNSTLMIPSVKSSDDGNYTCVAINIGGNRSHSAQLKIIGRSYIHTYLHMYLICKFMMYMQMHVPMCHYERFKNWMHMYMRMLPVYVCNVYVYMYVYT